MQLSLQQFHLLDQHLSRLVKVLADFLLVLDRVTQVDEYCLAEEGGVALDQVGLVEAVVLKGLNG